MVKSLPNPVINALSEVILNGFCGNIPLNKSDIEKLKPLKGTVNVEFYKIFDF